MTPIASRIFIAAYGLDLAAGDPPRMPHPVRAIGRTTTAAESWLRRPGRPAQEFLRGALLTGLIVAGSWTAARACVRVGGTLAEVLLAWTTLATKSLLDESRIVVDAVERGDLVLARRRLAMIVGRDTEMLDGPEILRAVIETIAEGLCDGVIAPIVYLVVGGVPLAIAYKAVNTLDSMIGHREAPYLYFGRSAARLDDIANFIPARLTAAAITAAAAATGADARGAWSVFFRDGSKHPSPNAGQSEAAMAGALQVRLGGVSSYAGAPVFKPELGKEGRTPEVPDARRALRIGKVASLLMCAAGWFWLQQRERRRR